MAVTSLSFDLRVVISIFRICDGVKTKDGKTLLFSDEHETVDYQAVNAVI